MPRTFALPRREPGPIPRLGALHAGAAARDITPALGAPLAGYGSIRGQLARRVWGRLHARALVLDDGDGERVALVGVDLHAGTRYLAELAGNLLAPDTGIGVDRLFLAGTHTHSGPGCIYGNTLYDRMTAPGDGLDEALARRLAEGIAAAVRAAVAGLRPARVGHGAAACWGHAWNRSLRAFEHDGADPSRFAATLAGPAGPPPGLRPEELAVDPRVQVIWAEALDGRPIGAFGTFSAHGTTIPARTATLSSDWPGVAARVASARVRRGDDGWGGAPLESRPEVPIAIAAGAIGDVDASLPGLTPAEVVAQQGGVLAAAVGEAVGEALALACHRARSRCQDRLAIRIRFAEPRPAGASLADGRCLARYPAFGVPAAGGSELGRNFALDADNLATSVGLESRRGLFDGRDPHAPKLTVAPSVIAALTGRPAEVLPFRLVRLDGPDSRLWLFGVPGEPTTMVAHRVEQALRDLGADAVLVAGVCGDYAGYVTTPKEYERQHYEGSSTIWGRATGDFVVEQARLLAKASASTVDPEARFEVEDRDDEAASSSVLSAPSAASGYLAPSPALAVEGEHLVGRWRSLAAIAPAFGPDPWIRLEVEQGGAWEPLRWEGLPVDDQTHATLIDRELNGGEARWRFRMEVPAWLRGRRVRYALLPEAFTPGGPAVSNPVWVALG